MDYKNQYKLLIIKAKNRKDLKGYKEKHHIQPKCMGGTNDSNNLVNLTAREHYIAHWLLVKIYPENCKLIYSLNMMLRGRNNYLVVSSKDYEKIKKLMSKAMSGEGNPMWGRKGKDCPSFGIPKTEECKRKLSEAKKGVIQTEEWIAKRVAKNKGKVRTLETLKKMSQSMLGKNKGKFPSLEARKKMSIAGKGRKHTKEQNKRKSERMSGEGNPMWGRKGKDNSSSIPVEINGIKYPSFSNAAECLNIDRKTITYRVNSKSKKFKTYKYI